MLFELFSEAQMKFRLEIELYKKFVFMETKFTWNGN